MNTKLPGHPCAVCNRSGGAVQVYIPNNRPVQYCSTECARVHMIVGANLKHDEKLACENGGKEAGAYLDQLGKTDLAQLSREEWDAFCGIMFTATCAALKKMADDEIPF